MSMNIENTFRCIENYFGCESKDALTLDVIDAHKEVCDWLRESDENAEVPDKYEFILAYAQFRDFVAS